MLADHRDPVGEFKFLAWSSIAQSVCQRAFSLLAIWCLRPRVPILHSAEEHNLSPFDFNISCLCQSFEINNNSNEIMPPDNKMTILECNKKSKPIIKSSSICALKTSHLYIIWSILRVILEQVLACTDVSVVAPLTKTESPLFNSSISASFSLTTVACDPVSIRISTLKLFMLTGK